MTSSGSAQVTLPTDTQVMITRDFDAPARLVWKAYTTPELIKRWWAGERGKVSIADVDLRVGGRWRYVLVANAGFEVAFHGEYREIVPNERLVNTEIFEGIPDAEEHAALVTVTFSDKDGRTILEMVVEHRDKAGRDMHINSGMEGGMQEAMDLLERIAVSLTE
jgi:uncharacterized protein YndB with AHSA1/START domain